MIVSETWYEVPPDEPGVYIVALCGTPIEVAMVSVANKQVYTSILFYTLDQDCVELIKCPKITRQMFHYHSGTLIQQKQFPSKECLETNTAYRKIVQSVIADSLNLSRPEGSPEIANIWKTEKDNSHRR